MTGFLKGLAAATGPGGESSGDPRSVYELPVSYGGEDGQDLEDVARHTGLTAEEGVAIHSGTDYRVYMLGVAPGFPYLGGMG